VLSNSNGLPTFNLNTPEDTGTLPAGDYVLGFVDSSANSIAGNSDQGKRVSTYDVSMHFTPLTGGGGNGGGPTPVPLPPAAWTGLSTLALLGFGWLRYRRGMTIRA
jgi:hypothetical protein